MWIFCLSEDSLETSQVIFSEKQWKNVYECRLLQSWLALQGFKLETLQNVKSQKMDIFITIIIFFGSFHTEYGIIGNMKPALISTCME